MDFDPAAGWNIDSGVLTSAPPVSGSFPGSAQVSQGGFTVRVVADTFDGTPMELMAQLQRTNKLLRNGAVIDTGRATSFQTARGERGVIARFTTTNAAGLVATSVFDGTGVEVVAMGPTASTDSRIEADIVSMIRSTRPVTDAAAS